MKKVIVFCAALMLGGCATTGGQVDIKSIQQQVRMACAFVPTAKTIADIISAKAGSALGIVEEICAAVTSQPLADGGRRMVVVRGVPVRGRRVK